MRFQVLLILLSGLNIEPVRPTQDGFTIRIRSPNAFTVPDAPVNPLCFPPCDIDACGFVIDDGVPCPNPLQTLSNTRKRTPHGSSRSSLPLDDGNLLVNRVRDFNNFESYDDPVVYDISKFSTSYASSTFERHLQKRSPEEWKEGYWTVGKCRKYLPPQIFNSEAAPAQDQQLWNVAQFLSYQVTTADGRHEADERAVGRVGKFADGLVQVGTGGLHGCTVVWVVSKKAVWGAHFWETYSMGPGQDETFFDQFNQNFQERVIAFINGETVEHPTNTKITEEEWQEMNSKNEWLNGKKPQVKDYIVPEGTPFKDVADLFQAEDEPVAFIFTPLIWLVTKEGYTDNLTPTSELMKQIRYPKRMNQIKDALENVAPGLATPRTANTGVGSKRATRWTLVAYSPLNYANSADRRVSESPVNQRGYTIFQHDPNALGTNLPAWRLFMQQFVRPQKL